MTDLPSHAGRSQRVLASVALLSLLLPAGCSAQPDRIPALASSASAPATSTPATSGGASRTAASAMIARTRTAGVWPGENGLSGVNGDPLNNTAYVEEFCTARGRPCPIAQTYTDRTSYPSMTAGTGWTFENFEDFPGVLVVSQGLVPEGRAADLAGCAKGDFDGHWRSFGSLMVKYGRGDSIVRLGWEFNGNFMAWHARDAATWIACYRHAADGIRATNPDVILDWTINAHDTPADICGGVSTNCYPGTTTSTSSASTTTTTSPPRPPRRRSTW